MDEPFDAKRLVMLRRLTRSVADFVRGQLKDHLIALAPLFRPRAVLGEFVKSDGKDTIRGAEAAFKEVQAHYAKIAGVRPYSLNTDLKSPLEVVSGVLEFNPVEVAHEAKTDRESKQVTVISPLKWILNYTGFQPRALRKLLGEKDRTTVDLESAVQHALMLNAVVTRQPALAKLMEALHFTISVGTLPGLGELPIVSISSIIPTVRPPDEQIIESTEMAGTDSFEEVVSLTEFTNLRDPFRDKLAELAKAQGVILGSP